MCLRLLNKKFNRSLKFKSLGLKSLTKNKIEKEKGVIIPLNLRILS